jgi:hypothetical protein
MKGYGLGNMGTISGTAGFFSSPQHPDQLWGSTNLPSHVYQDLFHQGVKQQGCEADY